MSVNPDRLTTDASDGPVLEHSLFRSLLRLGTAAVLALSCIACNANQNDNPGSKSVFSPFGSKKSAKTTTVVSPEVGAVLVRAQAFPESKSPRAVANYGTCSELAVAGKPPEATFAKTFIDGENATAWQVRDVPGQPPLSVVNVKKDFSFEIWELGAGDKPVFARKRTAMVDPAQASWAGFYASGVSCLPGAQLLVSVNYYAPSVMNALYRYDLVRDAFTRISRIERHVRDIDKYFETLTPMPDSKLVLYYTDNVRLASEIYTNTQNHLLLFSPHYPQGLEVLNLGVDDGSIQRWTVVGKTLWLDTLDSRKPDQPVKFVWSLDLSKVL